MDRLDLAIDGRVLAAAAAAGAASVLLMAVVASLFGIRRNLQGALRSHGATGRVARTASRSALVTVQVAVTLVLVSGAGEVRPGSSVDTPPEAFLRQVEVNLLGPQQLLHHLGSGMVERRRGDVVFVSSESASSPARVQQSLD